MARHHHCRHRHAAQVIDEDGDGIMDFREFVKLCKILPLVLYPAFKLQKTIMKKAGNTLLFVRARAAGEGGGGGRDG